MMCQKLHTLFKFEGKTWLLLLWLGLSTQLFQEELENQSKTKYKST